MKELRCFLIFSLICGCISSAEAQNQRQRQLFDSNWRFSLDTSANNSLIAGSPLTQWVWLRDDNAPNDAATMTDPNLDTSSWASVAIGTDVFNGSTGFAWFRSSITNLASLERPLSFYFISVDDNATVYLNGHLIGQHQGWSSAFTVVADPAWIVSGTNVLSVAVENTGGPGGVSGGVSVNSGPAIQPPGILVNQWLWLRDDQATNDAAAMTVTNLNTSAWQTAAIGQDVFNSQAGYAWFRTTLDPLTSAGRPLKLHFLCVDNNASVYLNGILVGKHTGVSQAFDILPLDYAWVNGGPNVLSVMVQNVGGAGGIVGPVSLECGNDVQPPGTPIIQWVWTADDNAASDAAVMAATNLNTSAWSVATIGQDVFNGRVGSAWFRSTIFDSSTNDLPVALDFLGMDDNATVYLNGSQIGQHTGAAQPFTLSALSGWVAGATNYLAVAVQNTNGSGGLLKPVLLQLQSAGAQGPSSPSFDDSSWRTVQLPHDYLIEGTYTNTANQGHGYLPQTLAWYRQIFTLPPSVQGLSVWLDFDGVYHDSDMWLNGHYLGNWYSGYASFRYDISAYMIPGGTNVLAVHVDPTINEGWFYEGAGIYRHVWLNVANPLHIQPWGTIVTSSVQGPDAGGNASATLTVMTTITNATSQTESCLLISQVAGPDAISVGIVTNTVVVPGSTSTNITQTLPVASARLWSLEMPQLYVLHSTLQQNNQITDNADTTFGIRSIYYDPNNGFFLNGKRVELQGMCNHQDFPGVGIGIPDNLYYWRVMKLKQSGVNAWRCSHNPPSPALLDACDRLGMLVMDENRNLGNSTGGYSAANASTTFTDPSTLDSMILRDRNHPSIIMWSMCNEEGISGTQTGADLFYAMRQSVRQYDTSRPVTSAALFNIYNIGIPLVEDLMGMNYNSGDYDKIHQTYPLEPIFGSETSSAAADRGEYANSSVYATCYNSPEGSWQSVVQRPFISGSFTWTGFDYKGEPGAAWPCVSSRFGILDICGLPKDMSYYFKAWWGGQPLVHILPHWNWTAGQNVAVWCYGNTASVEIFLNGVSQGKQTMPAYGHLQWTVPFASGTLMARGYDAKGNTIVTDQVQTTGIPASIQLTTDRTNLVADGQDVTVVYASILDAQGRVVPTASNLVSFAAQGAGYVVGTGNGDATCHQSDHSAQRYAFNGWCLALTGVTNYSGALSVTATSPGLTSATLHLLALSTNAAPAAPASLSALGTNGQVRLTWPICFSATSYNIKRSIVSGGSYTALAGSSAVSYLDTTVVSGNTYYYVVSSVSTNGESLNSPEAGATPTVQMPAAAPTGLAALPDDGQIYLSWNAYSGATGYKVKRSLAGSGPFTTMASTSQNSYTDTGLTNGTAYYYVVSALVGSQESSNSAPATVTPASLSYLVGTIVGTTGAWGNSGNTREMAMDWNLNTFFDAPIATNAWVGLDLGTNSARVISKIRFCPRATWSSRMVGGVFQGANKPDFSDAVGLFTLTSQPAEGVMTTLLNPITTPFRFVRYVSPPNGWGNIAELEFYSPGPHISLAAGTILGTAGTSASTDTNAFDDNIATYFDCASANGNWAGLDLGASATITAVRFCPRSGNDSAMVGGISQGANTANFSGAVNLCTVTNVPPDATLTAQAISNTNTYRYVRYLSPANSYGDVAEVQFFTSSTLASALPAVPTGLTTSPGVQEVGLSWTASSGAVTYNVKRGTTSGGPYTNIINRTATVDMDTGLPYGMYYYVVSAVNALGESANSVEASALLACSTLAAPTDLAVTAGNGQLILTWAAVSNKVIASSSVNAVSYNVLQATNFAGPFALVVAGVGTASFTDGTITDHNLYYYEVQTVNACGTSTNSAPVSGSLVGMNVSPALTPIPNQTIMAGQTLVITNLAGDVLAPPQVLSYALVTPPPGATINSLNGLLSWRPTIAQGGTTNVLTVVVSNNGQPVLSAIQNFVVNVLPPAQPAFAHYAISNGLFVSWIVGDSGPDYSLFRSTNLISWQLVSTTNQPAMPFQFVVPTVANRQDEYYRIRLGP
jgi:beta-galactosidase